MEKELIERAQNKDQEAFRMLVQRYQNMVVNLSYSLVGNIHDAEDVSQEVFVKVYNRLPDFRQESKFSTWLYRVAVNTSQDFLRRRKHHVPLDSLGELKDHTDIKGNISKKQLQDIIRNAIEKLPLKYREVVILKDIEGLGYREIAQILKCRVGTVESRLFRGRNILKRVLGPLLEKEKIL